VCCGLFGPKIIMSSLSLSSTSWFSSTSRSSSTSKSSFSMPRELVGSHKDSSPSGVLVVRVDDTNWPRSSRVILHWVIPLLRLGMTR